MRALSRVAGYLAASAVLLLAWHALSVALDTPALPAPAEAIGDFVRLFASDLLPHLLASAWRVLAAMAIGLALGAPLGLLVGRSPRADAVAAPLMFLTYPVPKAVFYPVLLVLFGLGNGSKIALIAIILFFQVLVTARDAARAVPASSVLSVRSLGGGPLAVFRHVVVPASAPSIFTALRISTGTAIAVLFFSESIAGSSGLGYYIFDAWGRIAYGEMFAGILAMALLGVIVYEALEAVEARVSRWTLAGL